MKSYPRDWIAWSLAAAIVFVATVMLVSVAAASQTSRLAEERCAQPATVV